MERCFGCRSRFGYESVFLVDGFGGRKRGDGEEYQVVVAKGGWSGCSSVETWGLEGFDCGGYGFVSRRGGGVRPWS